MKILLQNFETGLYLCPDGQWTAEPEAGLGFPNTLRATEYALGRRWVHTHVVVHCANPPAPLPKKLRRTARSCQRRLRATRFTSSRQPFSGLVTNS